MTSYIYLASDAPLPCSEINEQDQNVMCPFMYFTHASMEYFFFRGNFDFDTQCFFSYSTHFSEVKYQVASVNLNLPKQNTKCIEHRNYKALDELFTYIINHFALSSASYVEVLFCSEGSVKKPLRQKQLISTDNLSPEDLYYEELKLLKIHAKMKGFYCRRKTA